MRVFNLLLVFATLATAGLAQTIDQDVAAIPSCAINCFEPAITAIGCGQTDWVCICTQRAALRAHAFTCIVSACSTPDALKTQQLSEQICELTGVPLNSSSTNSATTSGSPSITAAPSSATTSPANDSSSSTSGSFSTTSTSTVILVSTVAAGGSSTSAAAAQPQSKKGLSKNAIVGIAVGAALGGLFLIVVLALIVFGYRKRRRDLKHLAAMAAVDDKQPPPNGPYELNGTSHMNEMSGITKVLKTSSAEVGREPDDNIEADAVSPG